LKLIDIPDGFATFLGAIATFLAGLFVIIAAIIAWRSVQRQIRSAENIEESRREGEECIERGRRESELSTIEAGFSAELIVYSRGVIEAASLWNRRAHASPNEPVMAQWPILQDPLYYRTNIGKIGLLRQPWIPMALIGFYANLLELNEQAKETLAGRPTVNVTNRSVAARLHIMASNLAQSLDGLNNDRQFPIQPELQLDQLFMPDAQPLSLANPVPASLQDVLLRLAGMTPPVRPQ
jgi:hypothetical protein